MSDTTFVMVPKNEFSELLRLVREVKELVKGGDNSESKKDPEALTKKEVLQLLKIDPSTYWRWVKNGHLKEYSIGGKRYCKRSEIEVFLK
ncbi:helix-turn-helix domain-containing protein [Elizabethkingia meningoseptica]|uniref:helix-turn-helix domain-containing protein n=1 Tax=Elizabethkingia meningoseptica TaxID=238 RepID=UPI0023B18D53|nr:helix-turn-helix domain-containing protein [Elizabethkingia meningoseptica]MDE5490661.1 helix-turn-helix domain-containing protein [Elizabethkingia meningoseptica]